MLTREKKRPQRSYLSTVNCQPSLAWRTRIMRVSSARRVRLRSALCLCAKSHISLCAWRLRRGICRYLQILAVSRDAKNRCRTFALSLDDKRVSATLAERFVSDTYIALAGTNFDFVEIATLAACVIKFPPARSPAIFNFQFSIFNISQIIRTFATRKE